jgi:ketopantoate reductase
MRIAFMGTGAIGASVVRALHLNKVPFTILVRDTTRRVQLQTKGINYELGVRIHIPLADPHQVMTIKAASRKKFDYVFLGMKTIHLKNTLPKAKKILAKDGKIILLQNGLPEEAISSLKPSQVISGIVGYNVQPAAR